MKSEEEVRKEIKKYFGIYELVGKKTVNKYGSRAWRFLDYRLLYALLIVRVGIGKPITVNTARLQQRGLRTTVQAIIRRMVQRKRIYISAHLLGKAIDFDVEGMTAKEVRNWIRKHSDDFPFKIRIEGDVTWVHMDVIWEGKNPNVYTFRV